MNLQKIRLQWLLKPNSFACCSNKTLILSFDIYWITAFSTFENKNLSSKIFVFLTSKRLGSFVIQNSINFFSILDFNLSQDSLQKLEYTTPLFSCFFLNLVYNTICQGGQRIRRQQLSIAAVALLWQLPQTTNSGSLFDLFSEYDF